MQCVLLSKRLCCRAWRGALAGRDVQAVAEPGSGKTLGYLLPALVALTASGHSADTAPAGPLALVLVPTRCASCGTPATPLACSVANCYRQQKTAGQPFRLQWLSAQMSNQCAGMTLPRQGNLAHESNTL